MIKEARERIPPSEFDEKPFIPALEIIQRSWAFSVLDETNLARMQGRAFSEKRYNNQKPEVVRVLDEVASAKAGKDVWRYEMSDGHHRFYSAFQVNLAKRRQQDQFTDGSDIMLQVNDVTDDTIASSVAEYGEESEYYGQRYLTDHQHLKLISLADKAHETLPPHRMPAHFLTKWPHMVGPELDEVFPAFPALMRIGFADKLSGQTSTMIRRHFTEINRRSFYINETPKGRSQVISIYQTFADILAEREFLYRDVAANAFAVVTTASTFDKNPDSEERLRRQAKGFLAYPEVDAKIKDTLDETTIWQRREDLEKSLCDSIREIASIKGISVVSNARAFYQALVDPDISYDLLLAVLQPHDKPLAYRLNSVKKQPAKTTRTVPPPYTLPTGRPSTHRKVSRTPIDSNGSEDGKSPEDVLFETARVLFRRRSPLEPFEEAVLDELRQKLEDRITRERDRRTRNRGAEQKTIFHPTAEGGHPEGEAALRNTLQGLLDRNRTLGEIATELGKTRKVVLGLFQSVGLEPPSA